MLSLLKQVPTKEAAPGKLVLDRDTPWKFLQELVGVVFYDSRYISPVMLLVSSAHRLVGEFGQIVTALVLYYVCI